MPIIKYQIKSILGGQSPIFHGAGEGQFYDSIAIDPSFTAQNKSSGSVKAIGYSTFSDTVPSGAPMWITTNPKNAKVYVYGADGELYNYDSSLSSGSEETLIGTPTSGAGNGMIYFNDNLLLATPTDISIYGQLSGAPSISNTWWTVTAGLTALTNTTYPSTTGSVKFPNHVMHAHTDNKVYFCDVNSSGQGIINKIGITAAGADDGSAYNVLDLPLGVSPTGVASYGTDLAVIASSFGGATSLNQGQSFLFLWDTISPSFYSQIAIETEIVTAIKNVNGRLYILGGSIGGQGWKLYRYGGGYTVTQIWESLTGYPPLAGSVDITGDRLIWGVDGHVMSYGYQNASLGKNAIHNIAIADTTDANAVITSARFVQNSQTTKYPIIGYRDDSAFGLAKLSTSATKQSVFRSQVFIVNKPFRVREIRTPLTNNIDANTTISVKIKYDDFDAQKTISTINTTNYGTKNVVIHKALEIEKASTAGYIGQNNFYLEYTFTGTSSIGLNLPIDITVETTDD